jgi:hypothetical protein
MKIRMNKTTDGSVDGAKVRTYEAGKEYDLSRTDGEIALARSFVDSERAKQVGPGDKREDDQLELVAPGTGSTNIAPPDQISTNVHPADIEVNPDRAVQPTAARVDATPVAHAARAAKPKTK